MRKLSDSYDPPGRYVYCPWDKTSCDGHGWCPVCGQEGWFFEKQPSGSQMTLVRRYIEGRPPHEQWEYDLVAGKLGGHVLADYPENLRDSYPYWVKTWRQFHEEHRSRRMDERR